MSIGQALAQAREQSGLSVAQVSASTRIRQTLIQAIERDDYTLCGGDFYARGHIRNIARIVGADPTPLLAEFDTEHDDAPQPTSQPIYEAERRTLLRPSGPNWSAAMALALVLVLGVGIYRVVAASPGADDQQVATPRSSSTPTVAGPTSRPPRPKPTSSALAQAPRGAVTVVVRGAGGKSWISVRTGAGRQVFQGVIASGQLKTFTDTKLLRFTIGNAGAVQLVVNGRPIGTPGGLGKVVRVDFGPGDPAAA